MADNYLITGYWGEPHVTPENDRGINAAIFGTGRFVLPVGEQFRAEYIGNNTVRMYDGKLMDNGAAAGIPAGEYIDLLIPEAGQGMKRNDIIAFQYTQDTSTLVEKGAFVVIPGEETSGEASDPVLTQGDLLTNKATFDQMALWRVPVSGSVISTPVMVCNTKVVGERIAVAHSTDGENYTVDFPGIAKLYTGMEITIIPDKNSTTTLPKLNINGLGAVNIKRRISGSTSITVQSETENFLIANQPIRIFYNGNWICDMARPHATDIYGTVPIECGGTGADNVEEALENLIGASILATDCNTTLTNGWYYANATTANKPAGFNNCTFFVLARNSTQVYQYFFDQSNGCVMQRYTTNGGSSWVEEWTNPPMEVGVEYRTTEKWMNKPVYTIIVDCGKTKSTTNATNIPVSFNTIIRTAGWCEGNRIPESHNDLNNGMGYNEWYAIGNGGIFTNWNNYPGMQTYVQLWYTKE